VIATAMVTRLVRMAVDVVFAFAAVAAMSVSLLVGTANAAERPAPVFTRDLGFTIPFSVDASATDIVEVQLLVSLDRGATWQLYLRQPPTQKGFRFRGQRDGEYWFASRTMDRLGQTRPAGQLDPQLIVVIDTTAPRLNLTVAAGAAGEIQARWEMIDERLAPQTFQLFYMAGLAGTPQPVAAPAAVASASGGAYQGQVSFFPLGGVRLAQVMAEVKDAAGNRVVATKRVYVNPSSRPRPNSPTPWSAAGSWGNPASTAANPSGTQNLAGPGQFAAATYPSANSNVGAPSAASSNAASPNVGGPSPTTVASPVSPGNSTAFPGSMSQQPSSSSPNPIAGTATGATPIAMPLGGDLPGGERPRMTNSKRFALEYDIESAGPGGVSEVELWMTRDRGASWSKYGSDADKQSPFDVTVTDEAIYGFRIVIVSKSGLASSAPRPGELADLWIGVDTTPPRVQLSSISFGEGAEAGKLDIRWEADDSRLGPRPVTLMYAENASGPWNTVAAGLPNSGQYYWPMAGIVPKRALLRIEVRDEAGNLGNYQLNEPINLQGLNPAGRIRGFAPSASPSASSPSYGSPSASNPSYSSPSYSSPSSNSPTSPGAASAGDSPGSSFGSPSSGSSGPSESPYNAPAGDSASGSSGDFSFGSGANSGASRIPLFGTRRR
jgi:hypothetical protein